MKRNFDDLERLTAVMQNSKHLPRGGVLGLAFNEIECLQADISRAYRELSDADKIIHRLQYGDLAPWCIKIRNWWRNK